MSTTNEKSTTKGDKKFSLPGTYIAIDMKSFYASVECVYRELDPLRANLLVADESRSDATICLAVSPSLKAKGVSSRPRLFEAKQAIRLWEAMNHKRLSYLIAVPRMAEYERISSLIYSVFLRYASPDDIHVYSIDECFIDAAPYLHAYREEAERLGVSPAHLMAMTMIRDVLRTTGITATVGIGTNLYLAKVAMDIVAKKAAPDKDGVRIAELDERSYCLLLWDHRPLTDFWQIGTGTANTLLRAGILTLGDMANQALWSEEWFYEKFGVDAEILIDHIWGIDPVKMSDIKNYHSDSHSLSAGQVLPRTYEFHEARIVFTEMIEQLCSDMFSKEVAAPSFTWYAGYDFRSLEKLPYYDGEVVVDYYGRLHPKHSKGTVRFHTPTNSIQEVSASLLASFDAKTDHRLLIRRMGINANDIVPDQGSCQLSFFVDYKAQLKERNLQHAVLDMRRRFGANAVFRGTNLMEGGTALERNRQIGGHRA